MTAPAGLDPKQAYIAADWVHEVPLNACRIDPTGRYVVSGSQDATVERFATADGARVLLKGGHDTWVQAITFSKDGANVITGGCDGKMTWWETAAAAPVPLRSIEAHKGWVRSLETSPDGSLIASGGNDNIVRLWNTADGKLVREITGHTNNVMSVTFHPTGQFLITGDLVGKVKQWDVSTGSMVREFDAAPLAAANAGGPNIDFGGVKALAISLDSKWLAAGGLFKASNPLGNIHEPLIVLFNWETQKAERQQTGDALTSSSVWRLRWLGDGTLMGVAGGNVGNFLLFWKTDAEKDFHRFALPNMVRDMDLHPDGLQVATAHHDGHLRMTKLAAKPA